MSTGSEMVPCLLGRHRRFQLIIISETRLERCPKLSQRQMMMVTTMMMTDDNKINEEVSLTLSA